MRIHTERGNCLLFKTVKHDSRSPNYCLSGLIGGRLTQLKE